MGDTRELPVPDGLEGMRVDAGLSRLLGLSRTAVGGAHRRRPRRGRRRAAGKSDRLVAGGWLEVDAARRRSGRRPSPRPAEVVAGLTIVHEDDDIVVVDKPVGVAAHPSPGWTGPTVIGGLAALGVRMSTSGAAERQGIVHRLDVGTTGVMVVAKSERAYTCSSGRSGSAPSTSATTPWSRATPTRRAARSTRRSTATRSTTTSGPSSPAAGRASPTTTRSRRSARRRCSTSGWRPAVPTRSACTCPRCATRASATSPTAPTRRWRSGWGWSGSGCTPAARLRAPRGRAVGGVHQPVPRGPGAGAGAAARVNTRGRLAVAGRVRPRRAGRRLLRRGAAPAVAATPAPGRASRGRAARTSRGTSRGRRCAFRRTGPRPRAGAVRGRGSCRRGGGCRRTTARRPCSGCRCRGCRPRCGSSRRSPACRRPPHSTAPGRAPSGRRPRRRPRVGPPRSRPPSRPAGSAGCAVVAVVVDGPAALPAVAARPGVRAVEAAPPGPTSGRSRCRPCCRSRGAGAHPPLDHDQFNSALRPAGSAAWWLCCTPTAAKPPC